MKPRWLLTVLFVTPLSLMGTLASTSEPPEPTCTPIEGVAQLTRPGRVLLLGELHGTVESPQFIGDVACSALASGREVVLGLELQDRLLSGSQWQRSYQDGRTSRAMAELIQRVADWRREGHPIRVLLFDQQPPGGGQARERAMASILISSIAASPEATHLILTGNAHSRVTRGSRRSADYEPMGHLIHNAVGDERVTSLDVSHAGGSAWVCAPECGRVELRGHGGPERWTVEIDDETRPAGHDGFYTVGNISASPPAVGDHDVAVAPEVSPQGQASHASSSVPTLVPDSDFPEQTPVLLAPFQGSWTAYQYGSRAWTLDVTEQRFYGVLGPDDWYKGRIRLRPDESPAHIDFVIEDCRCSYKGMASQGIFRVDGKRITLAAPTPGQQRPAEFRENDGKMVELRRTAPRK